MTSAPSDLAICTANMPTPPDARTIRTYGPGWSRPALRKPCRAVEAEVRRLGEVMLLRLVPASMMVRLLGWPGAQGIGRFVRMRASC
jgi:hypothetical protein